MGKRLTNDSSTVAMLLDGARETGELAVPEDGPVAWTTHADLAQGAVTALTEGALDGVTPALTASESVDMAGVAAIASELTGRTIKRVVLSDAESGPACSRTVRPMLRRTCSSDCSPPPAEAPSPPPTPPSPNCSADLR